MKDKIRDKILNQVRDVLHPFETNIWYKVKVNVYWPVEDQMLNTFRIMLTANQVELEFRFRLDNILDDLYNM